MKFQHWRRATLLEHIILRGKLELLVVQRVPGQGGYHGRLYAVNLNISLVALVVRLLGWPRGGLPVLLSCLPSLSFFFFFWVGIRLHISFVFSKAFRGIFLLPPFFCLLLLLLWPFSPSFVQFKVFLHFFSFLHRLFKIISFIFWPNSFNFLFGVVSSSFFMLLLWIYSLCSAQKKTPSEIPSLWCKVNLFFDNIEDILTT